MEVKILQENSAFKNLEEEWNNLLAKSENDNIFLTFDWLFTWWEHFGKNKNLFIVLIYDRGELVAIAPLMIQKKYIIKELRFIGNTVSDYEDIMISCDNRRQEIVTTLLTALNESKSWDIFRLNKLRYDSANFNIFNMIAHKKNHYNIFVQSHRESAPYIKVRSDWQVYCAGLRKKLLADTKRQISRLSKQNEIYLSEEITRESQISHFLDKLMEFHRIRRNSQKSKSIFEDKTTCDFFQSVARRLFLKGWLDLSVIHLNSRIAAIHFGFNYRNKFYYYIPGYSNSFRQYSIGRLLLFDLLHKSFDSRIKQFDFMIGEETYKQEWNSDMQRLYFITIYRSNSWGRITCRLIDRLNLRIKKILNKTW